MAARKIIAVVGATGAQGGGLVRSILADRDGPYAVRAITRDPGSDAARALASAGAEVVAADLADAAAVRRAFEGAYGAFCVTFFWAHFSPEREYEEARTMAAAARDAGLAHVVWSTLEDSRRYIPLDDPRMPTLMGRYKVPHFDAKGEADQLFRDSGVPTTFMLTSFYWDNLIHFGMGPRRAADGVLEFAMPMGDRRLPGIAAEDIGRCAHGIFRRGLEFAGRTIGIAGEHLGGAEMAAKLGRALGEPVRYVPVPFDVYRGLGFPGADDLGNMFQFNHDCAAEFQAARSVELSRSLNPRLLDFDGWLAANSKRIPIG
ncbi:MAG: NmrA/HSCARG family protein [Steroidobacteraceae bacterium]